MTQTKPQTFDAFGARWLAEVVAKRGGQEWTRGQLDALFNLVAPKLNWKTPIDKVVTLKSDGELVGMREAIIFYTGSVARITQVGWLNSKGRKGGRYRVQAAGYYATIGA